MKIGLLFGSFNPIHIGHVAIAKFMSEKTDLEQVWLIVSPHNPLKEQKSLANGKKRLAQVEKAIGRNSKIKVGDIEFKLPLPSFTINTLEVLRKKYPKNKFVIIMGSDNLKIFHTWKDYQKILKKCGLYIYPRRKSLLRSDIERISKYPNVTFFNAPLIELSSTFIRDQMKKGKDVSRLVP